MSTRFLIIDGYTLLHEAGLARAKYAPGDLAQQRRKLLTKVAQRLTGDERQRCTVVFDAIDAPANLPARFKYETMTVLFAPPGHEADEVIERLVSEHSAPQRLTVVSSDHRLQTAIRRRRGIGVDSDVFLENLESPLREVGPLKPSRVADGNTRDDETDLRFWLQEFEGISPEKLNAEVISQSGERKTDWDQQVEQLQRDLQNPQSLDDWLAEPARPDPIPSKRGKKSIF